MNELEQVCFQIISTVGNARSFYVEAIRTAKNGDIEEANRLLQEGKEAFVQGHHAHFELIQQEANGKQIEFSLLLLHAEDQLMSAESFGILAEDFIELYKRTMIK